ncbi:hypothetical protein Bhyg_05185 [Pseudolycoriella hygida]|uniref:Dedicator of cytokinesis C/D N-terminal domain-containing protein n=1 Tax=Pseudolycoriella hygida TaxID=35572 RepID=A0A9Q0S961_9DIPT|nr:hypothetical protein Bhyg_05185 [Pseudolycoriella hygida]
MVDGVWKKAVTARSENKPLVVEPIDFENFILKNKILIQNDPQRELLLSLYPTDDVSVRGGQNFV